MFRIRRAASVVAGVSAGVMAVVGSVVVPVLGNDVHAVASTVVDSADVPGALGAVVAGAAVDTEGEPVLEEIPLEPDPALAGQDGAAAAPDGAAPFGDTGDEAEDPAAPETEDVVLSAETAAAGVVVVGVTWEHGTAPADLALEIRTRTGSDWTPWSVLEQDEAGAAESDGGPVPGVRDGTEPYLAGEVDAVEVALRRGPSAGPGDPVLSVVSTAAPTSGTEPGAAGASGPAGGGAVGEEGAEADRAQISADELGEVTTTAFEPAAAGSASTRLATAAAVPAVYSRAQWGADESISTWTPQIGRAVAATVHHTAGTNDYTAAQVPALLRGIYTYHTQSRGWGDIGYNFLVDKFGRTWEGRKGGVDRAVIGAHASGVNSVAFGVSFLGNYDVVSVPSAALSAAARVIAWKFALHGVPAGGTVSIDGGKLSTVFGHRDVGQTTCPGRYLYSALPQLRSMVSALQGGSSDRVYTRDLSRDGFSDLVLDDGSSAALGAASSAGWAARTSFGGGWSGARTIGPGDWNGDGSPDLMQIDSSGRLWLYPGTASGSWSPRSVIGTGWGAMNLVTGGHDWDGDGRPDLLARDQSGALYLYPSDGRGGFKPRRQIGSGWQGMRSVAMIGDVTGGRPALVALSGSTLYRYLGDNKGGFSGTRTVTGTGWGSMTTVVGVGDMNDDGRVDVVARDSAGRLYLYPGTGTGGFRGRSQIGSGWGVFSGVVSAGRGGKGQDLYAVEATTGTLFRYPYRGQGDFQRTVATGIATGAGVAEVISPGDWDRDGLHDLMVRRTDGALYLHRGTGPGRFSATGTRIGSGWNTMRQVVGGGNWVGRGPASLLALDRSGRVWLYPSDGKGGFQTRLLIASGLGDVDLIINAGLWSGGRVPDLLTRSASTGDLHLRRGNGAGTLAAPVRIGTGWGAFSTVVGAGDVDGDGKPDLVARNPNGGLVLYSGNGSGGFFQSRSYGSVGASRVS